jgi:hypothetical protein
MKSLCVLHHYGLGDAIVCSGFVNVLSEKRTTYVLCKEKRYATSITSLYKSNKNVKIVSLTSDHLDHSGNPIPDVIRAELNDDFEFLKIGFNLDLHQHNRYDWYFYECANVPFQLRYEKFVPPDILNSQQAFYEKHAPKDKYVLIHNMSSQGYHPHMNVETDYEKVYVNDVWSNNIFDWVYLAQKAEEVHCAPSSFYCMMDSYPTTNKLFFHYVKVWADINPNNDFNNHKWNLVRYPSEKRN